MLKSVGDASGPGVVLVYLINHAIPVVQPVVVFLGAVAALVWYGIRFYDRFKYGPDMKD